MTPTGLMLGFASCAPPRAPTASCRAADGIGTRGDGIQVPRMPTQLVAERYLAPSKARDELALTLAAGDDRSPTQASCTG
jgi:hypothetical protein